MDVFSVRDRLVGDYREFTGSFVTIHDSRVREHVEQRNAGDYQWPDPWLSLNPNFAPGGTITELVERGILDPECERVFRIKPERTDSDGPVLRLHHHQQEALEAARGGHSYVLTTGTGSGKSLTYLIPIVDRVLRAKREGTWQPGVKAIVVYPMNALANSQLRELTKFLTHGYPEGSEPVTFERYTGQEQEQEQEQERARILRNPPDILLTNYVMLELVLTRPRERERLVEAAQGLWFLVLDELASDLSERHDDPSFHDGVSVLSILRVLALGLGYILQGSSSKDRTAANRSGLLHQWSDTSRQIQKTREIGAILQGTPHFLRTIHASLTRCFVLLSYRVHRTTT